MGLKYCDLVLVFSLLLFVEFIKSIDIVSVITKSGQIDGFKEKVAGRNLDVFLGPAR